MPASVVIAPVGTRNTEYVQISFAWLCLCALFHSNSIAINAVFCSIGCCAHTHIPKKCNSIQIPCEPWCDCVRLLRICIDWLALGDYVCRSVQFQHHYIDSNQNDLSKTRARSFALFMFAVYSVVLKSNHFPSLPVYAIFYVDSGIRRALIRSLWWFYFWGEREHIQYKAISNINSFGYYQAASFLS